MSDRETQNEAAHEWAESLAGDEPDLQDGLNESAGEVPEADGTLESDDLLRGHVHRER